MDGSYSQGGPPTTHVMGYFQGLPGYSVGPQGPVPASAQPSSNPRSSSSISIWAGDLDAYMDETFLRQAVTASGWGADITRIKVVRDHYSGIHAGYGFLDAASPEAAQRVISTGSGMPIPGTNRCWRLNMGRNAAVSTSVPMGTESNVYVGNLEASVTDYQLMTAFRPRYGSVRHAKVVCNEYGQSRGYGFVRFANPQEADSAVSEMNGFVFNQKPIRLSPAAGRARNGVGNPGGGVRSNGAHGYYHHGPPTHGPATNKRPRQLMSPDDPNNTTIFIGGTASHISEELLWREFSTFGELEAVRVPVNKTGFAFVRFKERDCAQRAKDEVSRIHFVSLNPNKPVRVEWATEQIPIARAATVHANADVVYSGVGVSGASSFAGSYTPAKGFTEAAVLAVESTNCSVYVNGSRGTVSSASGCDNLPNNDAEVNSAGEVRVDDGRLADGELLAKQDRDIACGPASAAGEVEPPSKRVAVGRPEYTRKCDEKGAPNPAKETGGTCAIDPNDGKSNEASEESPAMQFSWLNTSSSQTASTGQ